MEVIGVARRGAPFRSISTKKESRGVWSSQEDFCKGGKKEANKSFGNSNQNDGCIVRET